MEGMKTPSADEGREGTQALFEELPEGAEALQRRMAGQGRQRRGTSAKAAMTAR